MTTQVEAALPALGAGIGAIVVNLVGVEPQVLFYACVGAGLGIPFAKPAGRLRSAGIFILVMFASALLGSWAAIEYFNTPARVTFASKGIALALALVFHPLTSVVVASIPSVWDGVLRLLRVKQ